MKAQTQKGGVAWTFIDLAVSRLAVQIDDRHRRREKKRQSSFPVSTTKAAV